MARFDQNGDAKITREEITEARARHRAERFAKADENGDGKLTESEAGPHKWSFLNAADADGDGAVTQAELEQAHEQGKLGPHQCGKAGKHGKAREGGKGRRGGRGCRGGGRHKAGDLIQHFDQNADGVVTRDEIAQGMARGRAERFAKADQNGDGKLTESEAGPRRWRWMSAADADGDGAVTEAELQQAHEHGKLGPRMGGKGNRRGSGHKRGRRGPGPDTR